jgi:hypothetical protein
VRPSSFTAAACAAGSFLTFVAPAAHAAFGFDDVRLWAGSGASRAALVIDFNDGKADESLAWGFRWDGPVAPTGEQMFAAIDAADPRLHAFVKSDPTFGNFVDGIGYDLDGDGVLTPTAGGGDHYRPGFVDPNFWAYLVADADPFAPGGSWTDSAVGFGARTLGDGAWDGWSWSAWPPAGPGEPVAAAVPEPGAAGAVLVLAGLSVVRRRRRRAEGGGR